MKKKLLSLIAVSAALATAGSALIACGGGDDKGGNGGAKTEVTKEQWVAAFSLSSFESNFKANVKNVSEQYKATEEFTIIVGAQKYGDYSMTMIGTSDGVKQREINSIRIMGAEKDADYYKRSAFEDIQDEDGEWTKGDWKEGQWTVAYEDHVTFSDEQWTRNLKMVGLTYVFKFADKYDSFEYKNGVYTLTGAGIVIDERTSVPDPDYDYSYSYVVTATSATVKFEGGKVASLEMTLNNHRETTEDGETEITDSVFKLTYKISYGAQTITAPEGAVPDGEDE